MSQQLFIHCDTLLVTVFVSKGNMDPGRKRGSDTSCERLSG